MSGHVTPLLPLSGAQRLWTIKIYVPADLFVFLERIHFFRRSCGSILLCARPHTSTHTQTQRLQIHTRETYTGNVPPRLHVVVEAAGETEEELPDAKSRP